MQPVEDQIAAANAYEALIVPALTGPWAAVVADTVAMRPGERVLDLACGTGVLARQIALRLGEHGFVHALDANAGMLEVGRRLAPVINWLHGTAESLPCADRYFDAVVSQFGLMFFADRPGALREAVRVLRRGGRVVFAVWDALERNPAYAAEVDLLERLAGRRAADALRAPFVLGDCGELERLFVDAGIHEVRVATRRRAARFPSIRVMVEADLRGWLPLMGVPLEEAQIARILHEAEHALAPFVAPGGSMTFDTSAHIVTGTKA